MRILFIGNHNVGVRCLEYLLEGPHEVVCVVGIAGDPRERDYYDSVTETARSGGIPVHMPRDINSRDIVGLLKSMSPDLITVVSYRQILRRPILDIPVRGTINLHGALLPKYRGGSPVNWAIINGETETGVTIHYIDELVDHGPIIAQRRIPIGFEDTAETVFRKVTKEGTELFREVIGYFERGDVPTSRNRTEQGSYFPRRRPEDGLIDWERSAADVYNMVRALTYPFPGAFTFLAGKKCILWWGTPVEVRPTGVVPGQLFARGDSGEWALAAGKGALLVEKVQLEGGGEGAPADVFQDAGIAAGTVAGGAEGL